MPTAFIVVEADGTRYPLEPGCLCRIGRNADNNVILADPVVSRYHAAILGTPGGEFQLTNLGSRNGTLVNGTLIGAATPLKHGDVINICDHQMKFEKEVERPAQPAEEEYGATTARVSYGVISVLVVDIRDYTGLSQRLGENKISEIVGTFMREAGRLLADHGSWTQKYIGDAVMAVWNHKNARWDESLAILVSLERILEIAAGLQARFGLEQPIRVGAGINTGLAATGNMGSDAQADFTALGDVVNKAFRLETATKAMGTDIALGDSTYRFVSDAPDVKALVESYTVELKGYEGKQQAYGLPATRLRGLIDTIRRAQAAGI